MSHPCLDLSQLLTPGVKFAVRCESQDEARYFVASVLEQFPDKPTNLSVANPRWRDDNNGMHGGRAYFPDLNNVDSDMFVVGDVEFAKHYHYKLVYYHELLPRDLEESDASLDILLGGVSQ